MSRRGIAQYEATVILVLVSLSLASVVYEGLRPETHISPAAVFVNEATPVGGDPTIERLSANSSAPVAISSVQIDSLGSQAGVFGFGAGYSVSSSLCRPGLTTFFSVLATRPGTLAVNTDGQAWIAGAWTDSASVATGWQELMIANGSACSVTLPGGQQLAGAWNSSSSVLSSVPLEGLASGQEFLMYLPAGGGAHQVLLTTSGGFDEISV